MNIEVAKRLESVGEYYFSQKLKEIEQLNKQGAAVINLGVGSPDLPPHPDVIRVLQESSAQSNSHAYQGYRGVEALRKAFSEWYLKWYGVQLDPATEILPLIGSKEGIMHICMTYLNEGDEALVPDPGYPTYRSAVQLAGGTCREYILKEENQYYPDLEVLRSQDLSKVKMMFLNYPHMPTGQAAAREKLQEIVDFARSKNILLVYDNPYSFILNPDPTSLLSMEGAMDCSIELNSLSKSHNMAGWRVGMVCGSSQRINEVLRFKSNMDSGMFLPVQMAAAKALTLGREWYESINDIYRKRRVKALALTRDILGCRVREGQAGLFLWAKVPGSYKTGYELSDEVLYGCGVFLTPGGIFGSAGDEYIRVSLCSTEERFEEAIERVHRLQSPVHNRES